MNINEELTLLTAREELILQIRKLQDEIDDWRSCAKYDPLMEGLRFKGWDRSQMERCRKKYIEAGA